MKNKDPVTARAVFIVSEMEAVTRKFKTKQPEFLHERGLYGPGFMTLRYKALARMFCRGFYNGARPSSAVFGRGRARKQHASFVLQHVKPSTFLACLLLFVLGRAFPAKSRTLPAHDSYANSESRRKKGEMFRGDIALLSREAAQKLRAPVSCLF